MWSFHYFYLPNLITVNACRVDCLFLCMYFIHKRSICDLPEVIGNNMKLYADNSKILAIVYTVIIRLYPKDLECISVWMREWKIKLNIA